MTRKRFGFTLLETIVSMTVATMLILASRELVAVAGQSTTAIRGRTAAIDSAAGGDITLRELVWSIETSHSDSLTFGGSASTARFSSWCHVPRGWQERCETSLSITLDSTGRALRVATLVSDRFVALRDGGMVGLIYLADPALGGRWLTEWDRGLALPYAIGVVRARDTVILRVAPR